MPQFMINSDAFAWQMEADAALRSTVVSIVMLDRSPDWDVLVERFERICREVPMFRQRVVKTLPPAPPHWERDPDFDLGYHLRRVTAPAPGTFATVLEMARITERVAAVRAEPSLPYTQAIAGGLIRLPRWYLASVLRHVDLLASDVPGIPVPVYLGGARVTMQYPFGPTIGAGVNVTLMSYVDTFAMGINVDVGAIPDYDVFHDCLVAGFEEVLALAEAG